RSGNIATTTRCRGSSSAEPAFVPSNLTDAHIFAKYTLATKPEAKIGVLYQNDATGKDYLKGLQDVLGPEHMDMVVKEVSYEVSEPTVDAQVISLQGSG